LNSVQYSPVLPSHPLIWSFVSRSYFKDLSVDPLQTVPAVLYV